ncbi:unnamed protein product, partial [Rotaria sordida]
KQNSTMTKPVTKSISIVEAGKDDHVGHFIFVLSAAIPIGGLIGSPTPPVSVSEAFYSFDGNTLDLYSKHNGRTMGGSVHFRQDYVATGQAIVLNQSNTTWIEISNNFNIIESNVTVEAFIMLLKPRVDGNIFQFSSDFQMGLRNDILFMSFDPNINVSGKSVISTDDWHHVAFVYDASKKLATMYIDGIADGSKSNIPPRFSTNRNLSAPAMIGHGFYGAIDHLSISVTAKRNDIILWDASVAAYYPMDRLQPNDQGPNGLNGTSAGISSTKGMLNEAFTFNNSDAYFEAFGFTWLGMPRRSFSLAFWIRYEGSPGAFLTVANPSTCLLVLGIRSDDHKLVAYLPNATRSRSSVTVVGAVMPQVWVHVAFTWSLENRAILYSSGFIQGESPDAVVLSNYQGDNSSYPYTITLGTYSGSADCIGGGLYPSEHFMGTLDELYVFARELSHAEIKLRVGAMNS